MKRARESDETKRREEIVLSTVINGENDLHEAKARLARVEALVEAAKSRVFELELDAGGIGVKLIRATSQSNNNIGEDNSCSRNVQASLTVGPTRYPFDITFEHVDIEGESSIFIESELFGYEDDELAEMDQEDIASFLRKADLHGITKRCKSLKTDTAARRRRIYVDIISNALELVEDRIGEYDDNGMHFGQEAVKEHFGV